MDDKKFISRLNQILLENDLTLPLIDGNNAGDGAVVSSWANFLRICVKRGIALSDPRWERVSIKKQKPVTVLSLDRPVSQAPTSALDTESESLIQEALARLMKGKTTIVIAHRLSTLRDCDEVCVMDDGKVIEKGPQEELLHQGGLFSSLWEQAHAGKPVPATAGGIVPASTVAA